MATLNQLAYDCLSLIRGGQLSNSELVSINQVKFWIVNTRTTLIRQDLNKKRSVSDNIRQTLPCVPVTDVSRSECCDVTLDCTIKRTVDRTPNPVELANYDLLERISGVDVVSPSFNFISYARVPYYGNSKFGAALPAAFSKDGYIYLLNAPSALSKISITGVFEDPRLAANFANCDGTPCYSDDDEFPISVWMIEIMKKMIIDTDYAVMMRAITDFTGDEKGVSANSPQ